ncbi:ribbon-helix-helix domain-containing protein [Actinomadura flavalba]|uniref:ribbon-helix-helix domain-containing protein n=1 Tax=Actinomadura flavalba TaxID=1120938 RepID=UPI000376FF5D|nr:ribbon-helix-helix domain-containing protein [Actinomadura flavalba]
MARTNVSIPDDLLATLKALVEDKKIASVSGFLADGARLKLAYLKDATAMDELFGPPGPDERALVENLLAGAEVRDRDVA